MGEKKFFSQSKYPVSGIAQESFNICEVQSETTGAIVTWSAGKESLPNQHPPMLRSRRARRRSPRFIVLVGYKAIRKLVVMSVAFRTAEPADHKILFHAAFLLPDTTRDLVYRDTSKYRHRRGRQGCPSLLITKTTGSPPCRSVCILI